MTTSRKKRTYCHERILELLAEAGGEMKRGEIRNHLQQEGYSYYCIYEAHRRLAFYHMAEYIGSGQSPYQIVRVTDPSKQTTDTEEEE